MHARTIRNIMPCMHMSSVPPVLAAEGPTPTIALPGHGEAIPEQAGGVSATHSSMSIRGARVVVALAREVGLTFALRGSLGARLVAV
jgi:hypothetical protein